MVFSGTVAFLVGNICLLLLWCVALIRTGLGFLYLIVFTAILAVLFSVIQLLLHYNRQFVFQTPGHDGYQVFADAFVWMQILNVVLNLVGIAMLVRWICRVHAFSSGSRQV